MVAASERSKYYALYTAGTYADAAMTIPITVAEWMTGRGSDNREKSIEEMCINSPTYQLRQRLRDGFDTQPGAKFTQSSIFASIPFYGIGMPVAEGAKEIAEWLPIGELANMTWIKMQAEAQSVAELIPMGEEVQNAVTYFGPKLAPLAECLSTSFLTLTAQMITGYSIYMFNEVRINRQKYETDGKLKGAKLFEGAKRMAKAFLTYDLSYIAAKTIAQTRLLITGKDPWASSGLVDLVAAPIWWIASPWLGLRERAIETERTREWDLELSKDQA